MLAIFSFLTTGFLAWPLRKLAIRIGAMDVPNIARKEQKAPVPYLGGVAIAVGISIVTVTSTFVSKRDGFLIDLLVSALVPAIVLGSLGLIDDLKSLSPWPRLVVQSLVGTFVATIIVFNGTVGTPFSTQGVNSII